MPFQDLTGQKFGKLTVIGKDLNSNSVKIKWICKCDCGKVKQKSVTGCDLKSGKVKSCGCIRFGKAHYIIHGEKKTRLWHEWRAMKQRCSKNFRYHQNYYDRGITVCEQWKSSYIEFRNWAISNGYADDLTLDRIDNDKGYYPNNCRWATVKEQANNKRNNLKLTLNGITHTSAEWAEITGINRTTISKRVKAGWSDEKALTEKPFNKNRGGKTNVQ